jgi:DNA-directed RNA polymerase subunit RPC12/RpoP
LEEIELPKCPKCGADVPKPKKSWKMAGRPDKAGKRMELEIGLYECQKCHKQFREVLSKRKI